MTPSRIHKLTLTHFRNYRAASVQARGDEVGLVGPNGAGKTNCLEAISVLSPGRGLRRATLDEVADLQGDGAGRARASPPRPGSRGAGNGGGEREPALPDRPRTRQLGHRVRRPSAHGVA